MEVIGSGRKANVVPELKSLIRAPGVDDRDVAFEARILGGIGDSQLGILHLGVGVRPIHAGGGDDKRQVGDAQIVAQVIDQVDEVGLVGRAGGGIAPVVPPLVPAEAGDLVAIRSVVAGDTRQIVGDEVGHIVEDPLVPIPGVLVGDGRRGP